MLSCDSPEKHPRDLTDDAELLVGLTDLYSKSCDQKDYRLCRLLRDQVEILVSGQKTGIKIENDLGLSSKLF
jgi:hypothetical protein